MWKPDSPVLHTTTAVGRPLRGLPLAFACEYEYVDMERPCQFFLMGTVTFLLSFRLRERGQSVVELSFFDD
jgi:hypothetical protein